MPYYLIRTDNVPTDMTYAYTPGDYVEFWGECIKEVKPTEIRGWEEQSIKHKIELMYRKDGLYIAQYKPFSVPEKIVIDPVGNADYPVTYVPERTCKRVPITYQTSFYDEFAEEFEVMGCSSCEEPLSANWSYCPKCGTRVVE